MDPKMGAQTRSFFGHLAAFFCATRPWETKWLPRPPPRAPKTSPSLDLACLITFLVTSSFHFQISGHKFKCVGVVRRGQ